LERVVLLCLVVGSTAKAEEVGDLRRRLEEVEKRLEEIEAKTPSDNPRKKVEISGDLRTFGFTEKNIVYGKTTADWLETVGRVQGVVHLDGGHDANLRVVGESTTGRDANRHGPRTVPDEDVILDKANIVLKEVGGTDLDLTFGRQDVYLGSGLLVADGYSDPVAELLGPVEFFDGVRTVYRPSDTVSLDAYWLRVHNDKIQFDQNVITKYRGGGELYGGEARYETEPAGQWAIGGLGRKDKSVLENDTTAAYVRGKRAVPYVEGMEFNTEVVKEYGNTNMRNGLIDTASTDNRHSRDAWGGHFDLTQRFKEWLWEPWVTGRYAFFSGDKTSTLKNEAFEPLFNDWDTWNYGVLNNSNTIVEKVILGVKPTADWSLETFWWRYEWERQRIGETSRHFGEGMGASMNYWFSKAVYGGMAYAILDPGNAGRFFAGENRIATQGVIWMGAMF
jgi:hypothetical protein